MFVYSSCPNNTLGLSCPHTIYKLYYVPLLSYNVGFFVCCHRPFILRLHILFFYCNLNWKCFACAHHSSYWIWVVCWRPYNLDVPPLTSLIGQYNSTVRITTLSRTLLIISVIILYERGRDIQSTMNDREYFFNTNLFTFWKDSFSPWIKLP